MGTRARNRGWTLVEVVVVLTIATVLAAAAVTATREGRRQASLGDNFANLKQFASAGAAYAGDNEDRIWSFSWRAGIPYEGFPPMFNDTAAHANQAVWILRRLTGRTDFPQISGWMPGLMYSHLVLMDYLHGDLPQRFTVGPEDRQRHLWQASIDPDPAGFFLLEPNVDRPPGDHASLHRWPYSSSYELPPAFWSPDGAAWEGQTVGQSYQHNLFNVPGGETPLGNRRFSEVVFPSQKAMLFEQYQRHFGPRHAYFAYANARVPLLCVDGSASVRLTASANRGFEPNNPTSPAVTRINYSPAGWEPPTLSGEPSDLLIAHFRFTRAGLRGRDFSGPERPWSP